MFQEIYIIDKDDELTKELEELFKKYGNLKFKRIEIKDIELVYTNLPQLIIINDDNIEESPVGLCNKIREIEDNNIIPIIVLTSREDKEFKIELAKTMLNTI